MLEYEAGNFAFNKIISHKEEDGVPTLYLVDFVDFAPEEVTVEAFQDSLAMLHTYHRNQCVQDALKDPVIPPLSRLSLPRAVIAVVLLCRMSSRNCATL